MHSLAGSLLYCHTGQTSSAELRLPIRTTAHIAQWTQTTLSINNLITSQPHLTIIRMQSMFQTMHIVDEQHLPKYTLKMFY